MEIEQIVRLAAAYFRTDQAAVRVEIQKQASGWSVQVMVSGGGTDAVCRGTGMKTLKEAVHHVHNLLQTWIMKQQKVLKEAVNYEEKD